MYSALGIHWASSIPAFLALACVPAPLLFYKYGAQIRTRCKYAAQSDAFMRKMQGQMQQQQQPDSEGEDDAEKEDAEKDDAETRTDSEDPVDKAKEHEEEREEQEQEAIDHSYDDANAQPGFARIKTNQSRPSISAQRRMSYEGNPFHLDRVNTRESFKWETKSTTGSNLSRSSSRRSRK